MLFIYIFFQIDNKFASLKDIENIQRKLGRKATLHIRRSYAQGVFNEPRPDEDVSSDPSSQHSSIRVPAEPREINRSLKFFFYTKFYILFHTKNNCSLTQSLTQSLTHSFYFLT